jgi:hypothetical protein
MTRAEWAVYRTEKTGPGEWNVEQDSPAMPRRQAEAEARLRQAEHSGGGVAVHTQDVQFYAMNTLSGKIAL